MNYNISERLISILNLNISSHTNGKINVAREIRKYYLKKSHDLYVSISATYIYIILNGVRSDGVQSVAMRKTPTHTTHNNAIDMTDKDHYRLQQISFMTTMITTMKKPIPDYNVPFTILVPSAPIAI